MLVLRPGDQFEQVLNAAIYRVADRDRKEREARRDLELAVLTASTTAMCLGASPEIVGAVVDHMLSEGGEAGG